MEKSTLEHARWLMSQDTKIRKAAVFAVDAHHGYTCEFSTDPDRHWEEYDELETLLMEEVST